MKAMFWAKVKLAAAVTAAVLWLAAWGGSGPLATRLAAAEPKTERLAPAPTTLAEPAAPAAASAAEGVPSGEMSLPENRWTKVAEVPADPLGRELEPGRGAYWCFEPGSARFLRYGGYTPTDCNALWSFDLAARGWENPLKVDYSWPPPAARPGAGGWWSMAWDSRRKVVWLCGGWGLAAGSHAALYEDLWQYDPAARSFKAMKSKGFPKGSSYARIVYDSKNDLVVRAPGDDTAGWWVLHNRDATWVYDPNKNAWEGRKTPGSPKAALCAALVFDAAAAKTVYLAREADDLAGTWTFDAAAGAWAKVETRERPPARVVAGAAYDPENRQVLICGGVGGTKGQYGAYLGVNAGVQLADTWALDLGKSEWRKLEVGAPVVPKLPGERGTRFEHFCAMDYDTKNRALVLSAPTVGVWALRYRPEGAKELPALKLAALPPAPKPEIPKEPVFKQAPPNKKLLDLEENKWTQLEGGPSIGGGEIPMTYDEATGYCLKFGGCNNGGTTFAREYGNDLSAYDPATERWIALRWVDPCGPPRPANGCTRFYAYDPVRKVTWFASGGARNQLAASLPPGVAGGTWCYDGLKDRFDLVPSTGKEPSLGVLCCYDRANNLFVADPSHAYLVPHVCLYNPATRAWTAGAPAAEYGYSFGCYVDTLKSLLAVKHSWHMEGKDRKDGGAKTMAHDAAAGAWKDLAPKGDCPYAPGPPTLAYDPDNDVVLCVLLEKTYVYNVKENSWKALEIKTPKVVSMMVFDRRHKVFLGTAPLGCHMWAYRYCRAK